MPQTLTGPALAEAEQWLEAAAQVARQSTCHRRKCGSVLVAEDGTMFAAAKNQLPPGAAVHCNPYCLPAGFKSDKACCMHAEERSIMQALKEGFPLQGTTMVFASVDEAGTRLASGQPSCTICSKMALEAGVGWWILEHADAVLRYAAAEYNHISFQYNGE